MIHKIKMTMSNINKFKTHRKKLRFTQLHFCALLGISQGYLSDLENNVKLPSKSLILLLDYISGSKLNEGLPVDDANLLYKNKYMDILEKYTKVSEENILLREKLYNENYKTNESAAL